MKPASQPMWAHRQREGQVGLVCAHASVVGREAVKPQAAEPAMKASQAKASQQGMGRQAHMAQWQQALQLCALPAPPKQAASLPSARAESSTVPSLHRSPRGAASCADVLRHKSLIRAQHERGPAGAGLQHFCPSRS